MVLNILYLRNKILLAIFNKNNIMKIILKNLNIEFLLQDIEDIKEKIPITFT